VHLFYTPDISLDQKEYTLNEEESRHCVKVLRLQGQDPVSLIDGRGHLYQAILREAHPKRAILQILNVSSDYGKRNHYLHIAVAPTKNIDRLEWFLEKATEIGIDEISLIICTHSERKEVKTDRLHKVLVAAAKQSLTAYVPKLNEPVKLDTFLENQGAESSLYIAHCLDGKKQSVTQTAHPRERYTILIGPEGDFSSQEVVMAQEKGAVAIHLGTTRLRTETAALYACLEVNLLNRDLM